MTLLHPPNFLSLHMPCNSFTLWNHVWPECYPHWVSLYYLISIPSFLLFTASLTVSLLWPCSPNCQWLHVCMCWFPYYSKNSWRGRLLSDSVLAHICNKCICLCIVFVTVWNSLLWKARRAACRSKPGGGTFPFLQTVYLLPASVDASGFVAYSHTQHWQNHRQWGVVNHVLHVSCSWQWRFALSAVLSFGEFGGAAVCGCSELLLFPTSQAAFDSLIFLCVNCL